MMTASPNDVCLAAHWGKHRIIAKRSGATSYLRSKCIISPQAMHHLKVYKAYALIYLQKHGIIKSSINKTLEVQEMIAAGVLFLLAIFAIVLSIRSFCEKGFLLNNSYLYASKQEREAMDKKPYYRQSAIVFLLIGCTFTLNGFAILLRIGWFSYIAIAVIFGAIVYAIASSIAIERNKKQQ